MNIQATQHAADEDQGFIQIRESKTPYLYMVADDEGDYSDSEAYEATTSGISAKRSADAEGSEPKYQLKNKKAVTKKIQTYH